MKKRFMSMRVFKGFTLAELLGVIVVIGLLLLIIIPLIINGVKTREDDVDELQKNIIYEATDEYLDRDKDKYPDTKGNVYCISLGQLLEEGLLVDPVKKLVEEGNYSAEEVVEVKIGDNGVREYSLTGSGECQARNIDDIMVTISPDNSQWSQSKDVTVTFPLLENGKNEYSQNGNEWSEVLNNEIEIKYEEEGNIGAKVTDSNGNILREVNEKVEKIDRENPVVVKISQGSWNNQVQKQISITMTDAKSGVNAYMISTSKTKPSADDKNWVKYELSPYGGRGTISEYLPMGTYYVYVKDRAGNISEPDSKNSFTVKDDVPPTCTITVSGTKGNNNWYRSNVKLTLNKSDKESGIGSYGLIASSTVTYNSKDSVSHTADTKGITYYGYVKDKAGNTSKCSLTIKKDTVAPSCSVSKSGTLGNNSWYRSNVNVALGYSDSTSEIASYGLTTSSSTTYNSTSKATRTTDTGNITYYGYVKDKAGNTNTCKTSFKRDATAPTCGTDDCGQGDCGVDPGGSWFSSRWCGSSFWVRVYDNLSGVTKEASRHCYITIYGSTQTAAEWGPACGGSNDTERREWLRNNRSFANVPFLGSGYAAHGLNAQYARILYQFRVTDAAGNSRECGTHIKSFSFSSGDCPGGTGF